MAEAGYPRIILGCYCWPQAVCIDLHRSELVDAKDPSVTSHPIASVEDRTSRIPLDQKRNEEKDRSKQDKRNNRYCKLKSSLHDLTTPCCPLSGFPSRLALRSPVLFRACRSGAHSYNRRCSNTSSHQQPSSCSSPIRGLWPPPVRALAWHAVQRGKSPYSCRSRGWRRRCWLPRPRHPSQSSPE